MSRVRSDTARLSRVFSFNIYPKNIIIVAGATNAGKTALLLNVVRMNMDRYEVIYFSSEMGEQELRLRLEKFGQALNSWKFKPIERPTRFSDVIVPDAINIIDYLELTEDFYPGLCMKSP